MTALGSPVSPPAVDDAATQPASSRSPVLLAVLVGSVAVLVQTGGYALGWGGHTSAALVLWYAGFLALCAPFVVLLLSAGLVPAQRLRAALWFTALLYLSWLLADPVYASAFDETLHVATLTSLIDGGGFASNAMLPVSPYYPGLELAAGGVHWLTGLPLMAAQVVVVLTARLGLTYGIFVLASRLGRSARVGSVAVLLYAASAQFYFFNAQFSYQTMALALLVGALCLLLRACDASGRAVWPAMLGAQLCLAALAVTHHLTSWLTLGSLWLLALVFWRGGEIARARRTLAAAEIGTVVAAGWTVVVAPLLVRYLEPVFGAAGSEIARLVRLDGGGRQVLSDSGGTPAPLWEVAVMGASILLWCVLLVPSARAAMAGRSMSRSAGRWLLVGVSAAYPVLVLTRFSPTASEIGDRASTFVSLGLAVVVACWAVSWLERTRPGRRGAAAVAGVTLLLLLGGTLLGSGPDWQRTPGPYLAGAEQRSVDAETVAVGQWASRYLPDGARIASDTTLDRVLPTMAPVVPVTDASGSANMAELFVSESVAEVEPLVRAGAVDFVLVDTRMIGQSVRSGSFYEGSNALGPRAQRLEESQLGKFDDVPGVRRVLDGPIRVYDVRALRGEDQSFADRDASGLPGTWHPAQVVLLALLLLGAAAGALRWRPRRATDPTGSTEPTNPTDSCSVGEWWPFLVLPAYTALGAAAVAARFVPLKGSLALVAVGAVLGVATLGRLERRRPRATRLAVSQRVLGGLVGLVLVAAVVLGVMAAWQGLWTHPALPAPVTPTAAAASGGSS